MNYEENDYILLSALQHFLFCPRQCALIHIEQVWTENTLTALGRLMHEKAHETKYEKRNNVITARGLRLFSKKLGLSGQTDIVEFHKVKNAETGCRLPGFSGRWSVFPVEYKHGKPKQDHSDEVQLCAQAMCLEEMLEIKIPEGALFYGKRRRRLPVTFSKELRDLTERTAQKIHKMFQTGKTPKAVYSKKCESCSLKDQCLPKRTNAGIKVSRYIKKMAESFYEKNA